MEVYFFMVVMFMAGMAVGFSIRSELHKGVRQFRLFKKRKTRKPRPVDPPPVSEIEIDKNLLGWRILYRYVGGYHPATGILWTDLTEGAVVELSPSGKRIKIDDTWFEKSNVDVKEVFPNCIGHQTNRRDIYQPTKNTLDLSDPPNEGSGVNRA